MIISWSVVLVYLIDAKAHSVQQSLQADPTNFCTTCQFTVCKISYQKDYLC